MQFQYSGAQHRTDVKRSSLLTYFLTLSMVSIQKSEQLLNPLSAEFTTVCFISQHAHCTLNTTSHQICSIKQTFQCLKRIINSTHQHTYTLVIHNTKTTADNKGKRKKLWTNVKTIHSAGNWIALWWKYGHYSLS